VERLLSGSKKVDSRTPTIFRRARKRMRRAIEENEKLQAGRMATVNALLAKIHELVPANGISQSEEHRTPRLPDFQDVLWSKKSCVGLKSKVTVMVSGFQAHSWIEAADDGTALLLLIYIGVRLSGRNDSALTITNSRRRSFLRCGRC
jgi:hypothetical protein